MNEKTNQTNRRATLLTAVDLSGAFESTLISLGTLPFKSRLFAILVPFRSDVQTYLGILHSSQQRRRRLIQLLVIAEEGAYKQNQMIIDGKVS